MYYRCMGYMCNTPKTSHVIHMWHIWQCIARVISVAFKSLDVTFKFYYENYKAAHMHQKVQELLDLYTFNFSTLPNTNNETNIK